MNDDILKNYICLNPFNYLEIHKDLVFSCCPSWLNTPVGSTSNLGKIWNNDILEKIQNSIIDGTYSYCDKDICPYLSELLHNKIPLETFIKKENFNISKYKEGPSRISLCFDSSCNLSCPSCRKSIIVEDSKSLKQIDLIMEGIEENFGNTASSFSISGTAEPFASKTFKNFLIDFDKNKFPRLGSIYLQTNATLLNKEMWDKISNSHKLIYTLSVSVDAATEETYKIVRKGGDWNALLPNLEFISKLHPFKNFTFVVQDTNYKEMEMFYDLILGLHPVGEFRVYFAKICDWNVMSPEDYKQKEIWNESHPEFQSFLSELKKIAGKYSVLTNMNDIIEKYSLIKTKTRLL